MEDQAWQQEHEAAGHLVYLGSREQLGGGSQAISPQVLLSLPASSSMARLPKDFMTFQTRPPAEDTPAY